MLCRHTSSSLVHIEKICYFLYVLSFVVVEREYAALAQLVEHHFRKVGVPSSILGGGSRSIGCRIIPVM